MSARPQPAALSGRLVLVAGLGMSGAAAARALLARGARVRVVDSGIPPDSAPVSAPASAPAGGLAERAAELRDAGAEVVLGDDPEGLRRAFADIELLVVSPGLADSSPLVAPALAAGVPVWSEPELAWRCNAGRTRLLAVTGTNGKTTTTQLLAALLQAPAAGNIGTPLVELLAAPTPPPLVVAELSSFQLEHVQTLHPEVAVLLNLAPDHLDRHGSMRAYGRAKARIWQQQGAQDWTVANAEDDEVAAVLAAHPPAARLAGFTTAEPGPLQAGVVAGQVVWRDAHGRDRAVVAVAALDAAGLRGPHNRANVAAAVAAAICAGADPSVDPSVDPSADAGALAARLEGFRLGAHRLAPVATVGGVDYVDDSKATNPHAAAAALASFPSVVWIAGGLAKGMTASAFAPLAPLLRARARAVVTIGTSGADIAAFARSLGLPTVEAGTLDVAVPRAHELAHPGDTVLLAPACASMDQFTDYAHRGRRFAELVAALPPSGVPATAPAEVGTSPSRPQERSP